ncbi:MAG: regulatory protein GemA [Peptococcaceae bacterium]|nr:regulatory protein GemA [Peptococcaceae bacterium]
MDAVRKSLGGYGSIRRIWGLARSPELRLDENTLYTLIARETGKDSMRALTQLEIDRICAKLAELKDQAKGRRSQRRTDQGGSTGTVGQRRKIYRLAEVLGWAEDNRRVNGMCRRMFKVDRVEWLSYTQASQLIEALKKMAERQEG